MVRRKWFLIVIGVVSVLFAWGHSGTAAVTEDFSSDPVAGGRFTQVTYNTESSFTWNAGTQDLTAVLDVDSYPGYYRSNDFPAITDTVNSYFRADFRIEALDDQNKPAAYIGMMNYNHVNSYGQGLLLAIDTFDGPLQAWAYLAAAGNYDYGGSKFNLDLLTDYQVLGYYDAAARRLTTDVWSGTTLVGTSSCTLPSDKYFGVTALCLQNGGHRADQNVGSITLTVDNLSNVPEPSTLALLATGLASLLLMAWRRRKRSR